MEIDPNPVYEADQVVTYRELYMMREGCIYQYEMTRWYQWKERLKIRASIGCLNAMLIWMKNGKMLTRLEGGKK
jgi:hypothetical protein